MSNLILHKFILPQQLLIDSTAIEDRIRKRISISEFFGLSFCIGILIVFLLTKPGSVFYDLENYLQTSHGNFSSYYYGYWFIPFFWFLGKLPYPISHILFSALSIFSVFLAARVFNRHAALLLLTYQMFYILYYGQFTGFLLGGLGLLWFGVARKNWGVAGLGLVIAATKIQTGLIIGLSLLLYPPIDWKFLLKSAVVPITAFLLSILMYPGWIELLVNTILTNPPNDFGSITLWKWVGQISLVLWIPPLIAPLPAGRRIIAIAAANILAIPYFQQADLIVLLALPISGLAFLLSYIGFLFPFIGYLSHHLLVIVPITVYFGVFIPILYENIKQIVLKTRVRSR